MAEEAPSVRLREYLRGLKPEARNLLAQELERALLRGDEPAGASFILEELRAEARKTGRVLPRVGNAQRLFFTVVEPFLIEDAPAQKLPGRIARTCLEPIWQWICRDLMPQQAKTFVDQVKLLLAAGETKGAEQVARAFQDLVEQRLGEVLAAARDDDALRRLAGQIGTPNALENVREIGAIIRVRDALGVVGSRLPSKITNLADEQLENVRALLDSPIGRHREVFLYAMLLVMSRLGSPWQLLRLAIRAADSDVAARIAETPFAVAVDIVLSNMQCTIAALPHALKAGDGGDAPNLLKDLRDSARAMRTEINLPPDSPWGRQLAAARATVSKLLQAEIEDLPAQVRRLLRPRNAHETPAAPLDPADISEIEAALGLAAACRNYASELAFSETTQRVYSELKNYFDSGTQMLLDRLRTSQPAERAFRQSQVDAAVRFCAKLFGADFAGTLARAADVAAKGDQKTAKG